MKSLLRAVGELSGVAGNHARSYFEMAPASILVRLTKQLVAGYDTYGFEISDVGTGGLGRAVHHFPEVVDGVLHDPPDYFAKEFYMGGRIVRDMPQEQLDKLQCAGMTLDRSPQRLLDTVSDQLFRGREHEGKK
jgi:CRISPR-associated protein Cst2